MQKPAKKNLLKPVVHDGSAQAVLGQILELAQLYKSEADVNKILDLMVSRIASILKADVCSLYLVEPQASEAILVATVGLNKESVGKVRMKIGDGLVGKTLEWLKPVSVANVKKSRSFKYFPESGEELYASFLAVPLIYNRNPVGALVIQHKKSRVYPAKLVNLLIGLAVPALNVIERIRILGTLEQISQKGEGEFAPGSVSSLLKKPENITFRGIAASPGIAIGKVSLFRKSREVLEFEKPKGPIDPDVEKMRLLEAFRWVEEEIRSVQKRAKDRFGLEELSIFEAYRMVLEKGSFREEILKKIDEKKTAVEAVKSVIDRYVEELNQAKDEYIRERLYDIQDLGRKLTDFLIFGAEISQNTFEVKEEAILFSEAFSISDFVDLDLEKTKGLLSSSGGASSHLAILAESLGIPTVLGLGSFGDLVCENDSVIMDGETGMVILNPFAPVVEAYKKENKADEETRKNYLKSSTQKVFLKGSKTRITVGANLGLVTQISHVLQNGAEEIGLYRTELPFLVSRSLPTEEEQEALYTRVLKEMDGKPVTIRTLDIGGDKYLPYLSLPKEENPFLGWRSIRISLEREDLFRIQLRALIKASVHGNLKIVFPMISSIEEIKRAKAIFMDVKREIKGQGMSLPKIPVGIMLEVPSAVEIIDLFAPEVDFFSVGTNDLTQYTLAVDRNNPKVAKLYNPLHPAILRMLKRIVTVCSKAEKKVTVCGEMAAQPLTLLALLALGVENISLGAPLIPKIKALIQRLDAREIKALHDDILNLETAEKIEKTLRKFFDQKTLGEFLPS